MAIVPSGEKGLPTPPVIPAGFPSQVRSTRENPGLLAVGCLAIIDSAFP
jgi:hypothetical protein